MPAPSRNGLLVVTVAGLAVLAAAVLRGRHGSGERGAPGAVGVARAAAERVELAAEPEGGGASLRALLPVVGHRVVDRRTGEPVPDFAVALRDQAGTVQRLRTDPSGRLDVGRLELRAVALLGDDDGASPAWRNDGLADRTWPVDVGPTVLLALDPPLEGPARRDARVLLGPPGDSGAAVRARLRAAEAYPRPWARFDAYPPADASSSWTVVLLAGDGHASGRAVVPAWVGVRRSPVSLRLLATARLPGRALDAFGEPAAGVVVRAFPRSGVPLAAAVEATVAEDGRFVLEPLPPGSYTLSVDNVDHGSARLDVEVALEEEDEVELRLVLPPGGPLEGRVVFARGDRERTGFVALQRGTRLYARDLVPAGDFVATFSFRHLPEGRYRLVLHEGGRQVLERTVQVPGPGLELHVE